MKKLFLFLSLTAMALTFNSCSDDDSSTKNDDSKNNVDVVGGTLKMKVDGVQKNYNNVVVDQELYDDTSVYLTVTASEDGNPAEYIKFSLWKGDIGAEAANEWEYTRNGVGYSTNWSYNDITPQINAIVQTNKDNKIKGSFTGKVGRYTYKENGEMDFDMVNLTEGTFEATYEVKK